jgi:hypothetical protein
VCRSTNYDGKWEIPTEIAPVISYWKGVKNMREVRHILVLFLVSLIYAGVAHTQGNPINGLYRDTIVGFAGSDASLFAATGGSGNHLINNKEYRSKVESAFREREQLAHNRKDKLFSVLDSGLSLEQQEYVAPHRLTVAAYLQLSYHLAQ